jgi:pimeloyl-ACP methyl ester carboxylesterase
MRRVCSGLVWVGLCACAVWTRAAAAGDAATLPLTECRLEHPLNLASIPARCGTLRVPLDREHPKGGSIDLKVAVVPALNRRSTAPPMFLLAGGPGQSAMQVYVSLANAFARVNRNHAIVLLDQRGTGGSSPQSCDFPEEWQQPADDPLPALRKATVACLAKLGQRVRFYTTSIAVRDLDEMRAALGFEQIDLYGASYGTRVAELYMRRYPARVHAVILDGVTYPEQMIGVETPQDGERALNLIITRCRLAPYCAAAYP